VVRRFRARQSALAPTETDSTKTDMIDTSHWTQQQRRIVPLPEVWWDGPRQYFLAWRAKSSAIFARSALSTEDQHLFYLYNVRCISGTEHLGELILKSPSLNKCVDRADKWERSK
jgi:hypothetical protein